MYLLTDLLDLLVPIHCAGCGWAGASPCPSCARSLLALEPRPLSGVADAPVVVAAPYAAHVRALLLAHKERRRQGLSVALGGALGEATAVALALSAVPRPPGEGVVLVPIPSVAAAVRRRGSDTVAALAKVAAAQLSAHGVPAQVRHHLHHIRRVADQADLDAVGRARNLEGALGARHPRARRASSPLVIVVDDVVTTGSTMSEAIRALRGAGHRAIAGAAVAGTGIGRRSAHPGQCPSALVRNPGSALR